MQLPGQVEAGARGETVEESLYVLGQGREYRRPQGVAAQAIEVEREHDFSVRRNLG
jgi:hypothetical protein